MQIGMGPRDNGGGAILLGHPQHGQGILKSSSAVIHAIEDMAVNVDQTTIISPEGHGLGNPQNHHQRPGKQNGDESFAETDSADRTRDANRQQRDDPEAE
jgi:hypothetical protein